MTIPRVLSKHLQPNEKILALAHCQGILRPTWAYLAVTDRRVLYVVREGLASWIFRQMPVDAIYSAGIDESFFSATVTILAHGKVRGEWGQHEVRFPDMPKKEAAEFVSALYYLRDQISPEIEADQTKRCPDCYEVVRKRARVCSHCGHRFM